MFRIAVIASVLAIHAAACEAKIIYYNSEVKSAFNGISLTAGEAAEWCNGAGKDDPSHPTYGCDFLHTYSTTAFTDAIYTCYIQVCNILWILLAALL